VLVHLSAVAWCTEAYEFPHGRDKLLQYVNPTTVSNATSCLSDPEIEVVVCLICLGSHVEVYFGK
jgi:hypothetical protein